MLLGLLAMGTSTAFGLLGLVLGLLGTAVAGPGFEPSKFRINDNYYVVEMPEMTYEVKGDDKMSFKVSSFDVLGCRGGLLRAKPDHLQL